MKRIDKNRSMLANKIFLVFRTLAERNRFVVDWKGEISLTFPVKPTKGNAKYFNDFHYLQPLDFYLEIEKQVGSEMTGRTLFGLKQVFYCDAKEIAVHRFKKLRETPKGYKADVQRQILVESLGWLAEFENFFCFLGIEPDLEMFNEKEYFGHNNNERIF